VVGKIVSAGGGEAGKTWGIDVTLAWGCTDGCHSWSLASRHWLRVIVPQSGSHSWSLASRYWELRASFDCQLFLPIDLI